MSPFRSLKIAEAALLLDVNVRTIKRWMRDPVKRAALGAVRRGTQWRIPMPDNPSDWALRVRVRTEPDLERYAERALTRLVRARKETDSWAKRLWLACMLKAGLRGLISKTTRAAIDIIWEAASRLTKPSNCMKELRGQIERQLHHLSEEERRAVMRTLANQSRFDDVERIRTKKEFEKVRRLLDYIQALKLAKRKRRKSTNAEIRPFLYPGFVEQMNDTGEYLPPRTNDRRSRPKRGIAERTIKIRHRRKDTAEAAIIAQVYNHNESPAVKSEADEQLS